MATQAQAEIVSDPVGHISISGVHGRDELNDRLARVPVSRDADSTVKPILLGAAIGLALMFFVRR